MEGTERTPAETIIDKRWDNREDDRESYDMMFDQAIKMLAREERAVPALVMAIINSWEKNPRNIPMPVLNACYNVCLEDQEMEEFAEALRPLLRETERS